MTKNEIIDKIARDKVIEKFISNTAKTSNEDLNDLAQDVYLILLGVDEEKIVEMWEKEELGYFISRIITNQYRSETSPFHSRYRKWSSKRSDLKGDPTEKSVIEKEERWMQMKRK